MYDIWLVGKITEVSLEKLQCAQLMAAYTCCRKIRPLVPSIIEGFLTTTAVPSTHHLHSWGSPHVTAVHDDTHVHSRRCYLQSTAPSPKHDTKGAPDWVKHRPPVCGIILLSLAARRSFLFYDTMCAYRLAVLLGYHEPIFTCLPGFTSGCRSLSGHGNYTKAGSGTEATVAHILGDTSGTAAE